MGTAEVPLEPRLPDLLAPWSSPEGVSFSLEVGPGGERTEHPEVRRRAAEVCLGTLYNRTPRRLDLVRRLGGGRRHQGAIISLTSGESREVQVPPGKLCSSTRAELFALRAALTDMDELTQETADTTTPPIPLPPIVVCTDSLAALAMLSFGPTAQQTTIGADIWHLLGALSSRNHTIHLQWVPAHCGIAGNEQADTLAKEAAALPQASVPTDISTIVRAVHRTASRIWQDQWPSGLFKKMFGKQPPLPISGDDRGRPSRHINSEQDTGGSRTVPAQNRPPPHAGV